MSLQLTNELRQAIADRQGESLQVEDPVSHTMYVLVRLERFQELQRAAEFDSSEPDPRAIYPAFAAAVKEELDAPGMDLYDAKATPS
jgi:hypothetical protein